MFKKIQVFTILYKTNLIKYTKKKPKYSITPKKTKKKLLAAKKQTNKKKTVLPDKITRNPIHYNKNPRKQCFIQKANTNISRKEKEIFL